jgi:hypothetical protein
MAAAALSAVTGEARRVAMVAVKEALAAAAREATTAAVEAARGWAGPPASVESQAKEEQATAIPAPEAEEATSS